MAGLAVPLQNGRDVLRERGCGLWRAGLGRQRLPAERESHAQIHDRTTQPGSQSPTRIEIHQSISSLVKTDTAATQRSHPRGVRLRLFARLTIIDICLSVRPDSSQPAGGRGRWPASVLKGEIMGPLSRALVCMAKGCE